MGAVSSKDLISVKYMAKSRNYQKDIDMRVFIVLSQRVFGSTLLIILFCAAYSSLQGADVLDPGKFRHYVQKFNTMEEEFHPKAVTNAQSWDWMLKNIPFFECSSSKIEEIYYYRWWTYRKHITKQDGYSGYVMTEFITFKSANSSAYCHQLAEGRWMLKSDLEMEIAGRLVVLETGLRNILQNEISGWVHAEGIDPKKIPLLLEKINDALDQQFNEFAAMDKFQVIIEEEALYDH